MQSWTILTSHRNFHDAPVFREQFQKGRSKDREEETQKLFFVEKGTLGQSSQNLSPPLGSDVVDILPIC